MVQAGGGMPCHSDDEMRCNCRRHQAGQLQATMRLMDTGSARCLTRLTAKKNLHDVTVFLLRAFTAKKKKLHDLPRK